MHKTVQNLIEIEKQLKSNLKDINILNLPKIIAVSKTFTIDKIYPLINHGHLDFGENKVKEAIDKWSKIKIERPNLKLHMVGKLQSNKVKLAVKLFDYIHSVDSEKLAKKILEEQNKINRKIKIFLQVNIGDESQKTGVNKSDVIKLVNYCKDIGLDIIGLMCIPPVNESPDKYFQELRDLNLKSKLSDLSMGMSSDYLKAVENSATFIRIGSNIFGERI